ncbi:MAG: hypothetical protein ACOYLN_12265 [Blastocatellia bacterium]
MAGFKFGWVIATMMECVIFQDLMTDYLEGELDGCRRAECAAHRLVCRECRGLFEDVQATVVALRTIGGERGLLPSELPDRILAATTAGEMNGCREFDRLLAEYFDGVILAPTYQTFQHHFIVCANCRRLISGIEEAIALCHEIREERIEMAPSLPGRIVEVMVGEVGEARATVAIVESASSWFDQMVAMGDRVWDRYLPTIDNARVTAGILILAASGLLVLARFGSFQEMVDRASSQADQIVGTSHERFNRTGLSAMATKVARGNMERLSREMNTIFFTGELFERTGPAQNSENKSIKKGRNGRNGKQEQAGESGAVIEETEAHRTRAESERGQRR